MVTGEMVRGLPLLKFDNNILCTACDYGKQTKGSHPLVVDSSIAEPLELVHIDLCGLSTIASLHPKKYILFIIDGYTCFTTVFFLRLKYEKPQTLINFIKKIKLQNKFPIRNIRSDNGIEFTIDF